jgi:hypothetical protein
MIIAGTLRFALRDRATSALLPQFLRQKANAKMERYDRV